MNNNVDLQAHVKRLANQYRQKLDQRNDSIRTSRLGLQNENASVSALVSGNQDAFALSSILSTAGYLNSGITIWNLPGKFADSLAANRDLLPSEYILKHHSGVFGQLVFDRFRNAFLYAVDNVRMRPYSTSWMHRSFRSDNYLSYAYVIGHIVTDFWKYGIIDADICDILTGNLPEDVICYLKNESERPSGFVPEVLAYELDQGNPRLEEIVTDIINGDNAFSKVSRNLIMGIILSRNSRMHRQLCRLLLAAQLQEGLRQTICECADCGSIEAFGAILETIAENDLIRFSSVKRAVGTWLGLINTETKDTDRISRRTVELICRMLSDMPFREECLNSEDAMQIYIALWCHGFESVQRAVGIIDDIAHTGSRHQLLCAGYFLDNLDNQTIAHTTARAVLRTHRDEEDITAVYLPHLLSVGITLCPHISANPTEATPDNYFESTAEALDFCDWLISAYRGMKQKSKVFDPCVFPWNAATLHRHDLIKKAMMIAAIENDQPRIDVLCGFIPDCDADYRSTFFKLLTSGEKTPAVRAAIIKGLSDKSEPTRLTALKACSCMELTPDEYLAAEDVLRLKYDSLRKGVIGLLLKQPDEQVYRSAERLLSAKKTEKRTAALDMIAQLSADNDRAALFARCLSLTDLIVSPTTQEKILIDALRPKSTACEDALFADSDRYIPVIENDDFVKASLAAFTSFFPDSSLEKQALAGLPVHVSTLPDDPGRCPAAEKADALLKDLSGFFTEHEAESFSPFGDSETRPLGSDVRYFSTVLGAIPRMDLWKEWLEDRNPDASSLMGMYAILHAQRDQSFMYACDCSKYLRSIFGSGYEIPSDYPYADHMRRIVDALIDLRLSKDDRLMAGAAIGIWIARCLADEMLLGEKPGPNVFGYIPAPASGNDDSETHYIYGDLGHPPMGFFIAHPQIAALLKWIELRRDARFRQIVPITINVYNRFFNAHRASKYTRNRRDDMGNEIPNQIFTQYPDGRVHCFPCAQTYLYARLFGLINDRTLLLHLSDPFFLYSALTHCTSVLAASLEERSQVTARSFRGNNITELSRQFEHIIGEGCTLSEDQMRLADICREAGKKLLPIVLEPELKRGDTPTEYSRYVRNITALSGADLFVRILSALGKDTLDRSVYWHSDGSKRGNLSFLLYRCVPAKGDTAETLAKYLAGTDIDRKRLVEAALFNPEWIDIIGEYLAVPGFKSACYYFIAHMNEAFDERRMAIITRFTPLGADELNQGAFDIKWFRNAWEQLGPETFSMIYDAAKYISDSNRHTRARKYADAVLGRLDIEETETYVSDKRNKDLLMAYALIPLKDEDDLIRRYLFIQEFLKESRKFGAQRSASEKIAAETALRNLATNAGYADTMRLILRMETKLSENFNDLFTEKSAGDLKLRLCVDSRGAASILCEKDGKPLKTVPARVKKDPVVIRLLEGRKHFTDQYSRAKRMLEESMEDESAFTLGELAGLQENPVVFPMLSNLIFIHGDTPGLFTGASFTDMQGRCITCDHSAELRIAHPLHLFRSGQWPAIQRYIIDGKIIQPFRQVFRELYVKTADEAGSTHSLRYAGHQIQPRKAAACLKSRRWVTDIESGLQKVYYRENIVATMFALADWFTPADIEAPTLEYVAFYNRKSGAALKIDEVPDVIFSEVMRDVDMAVSVAHVGGVDPEASHSTVEMRAAILEFTLPLLKLNNVRIQGDHALIDGSLARYSIHLGSGVVHQIGGAMLNVIPVHSQHRGRIFLPFVDDDPKTAEIISKVILFSEDSKIKDPTILEQLSF